MAKKKLKKTTTMEGRSVYSVSEVAKHNKEDDCWVIVHGHVLDVTSYLLKHPGGKNLIFRSAGQDCTKDFEAMFHSVRARQKLQELVIGEVEGGGAASGGGQKKNQLSPWSLSGGGGGSQAKRFVSAPAGGVVGRGPYGLGPPVALPSSSSSGFLSSSRFSDVTLMTTQYDDAEQKSVRRMRFSLRFAPSSPPVPCFHIRIRCPLKKKKENEEKEGEEEYVVRSYTPVSWGDNYVEVCVKLYGDGPCSSFLHQMRVGDRVEMSGPHVSLVWSERKMTREWSSVTRVVMVCMGTGITPMLQLLRSFNQNELWWTGKKKKKEEEDGDEESPSSQGGGRRRMRCELIVASKSPQQIMCAKEISELCIFAGVALVVTHVHSSRHERVTPEWLKQHLGGEQKISEDFSVASDGDALMCVCGTDAFVEQLRHVIKDTSRFFAF